MALLERLQHRDHPVDAIPIEVMIEYVQILLFETWRHAESAAVRAGHGHLDHIYEFASRQEQQDRERGG
jgi:hypothetical protein